MNQVFLILVHKNPAQLFMLLKQLESNKSHFYIHVDLKSNEDDFKNATKTIPNIHFISERYDVQWGSISIVLATLALIEELAKDSQFVYSHAHLISGEDLLIKPIDRLLDYFSTNHEKNYINIAPLPIKGWWNGGWYRITDYHFGKSKRSKSYIGKVIRRLYHYSYLLLPFLKKQLPKDLIFYGGSAWWSLSRNSINYIREYYTKNPKFIDFLKYSLLPDELFFQTIIMNNPHKTNIVPDYKRFIKWEGRDKTSPELITFDDINDLKRSDAFFARKINIEVSKELYRLPYDEI